MTKEKAITVQNVKVKLFSQDDEDYISLTDMTHQRFEGQDQLIKNWLQNRNTIEFLGIWEQISHN